MDPKIAIILCTHNGQEFLIHQLNSIKSQTYKNFDLFISDDCSSDETQEILRNFKFINKDKNIRILKGPNLGFAKNFLYTLKEVYSGNFGSYDFYAFSDQDDVWDEDKLEHSLNMIYLSEKKQFILYCGRTRYINQNGKTIGLSPRFIKKPSLKNALVQSIAGGNTMLLDAEVASLMTKIDLNLEIISHDWLIYLIVAYCDGNVIYDDLPKISYRQHNKNLIGSNRGYVNRLKRIIGLMNGSFKLWVNLNILQLHYFDALANKHNQLILSNFILTSSSSIIERLNGLVRSGVYRQTFLSNLALWLATILRKIL